MFFIIFLDAAMTHPRGFPSRFVPSSGWCVPSPRSLLGLAYAMFLSSSSPLRFALLLALFAAAPLRAQVTVTAIAVSDNSGQSVEPLTGLDLAAVSEGNVAHRADVREGSRSRSGVRLNGATAVRGSGFSVPPGDAAPGTASTFSGFLPEIFVNTAGQIAFTATTVDSGGNGFWSGAPGAPQRVFVFLREPHGGAK